MREIRLLCAVPVALASFIVACGGSPSREVVAELHYAMREQHVACSERAGEVESWWRTAIEIRSSPAMQLGHYDRSAEARRIDERIRIRKAQAAPLLANVVKTTGEARDTLITYAAKLSVLCAATQDRTGYSLASFRQLQQDVNGELEELGSRLEILVPGAAVSVERREAMDSEAEAAAGAIPDDPET